MSKKSEPWYIHGILYVVIAVLVIVLINVAIIEPSEVIERETYFKNESRLRMTNLKHAQILWEKKHGQFTDNLDSLVKFLSTDHEVWGIATGYDSVRLKPTNPFSDLTTLYPFISDSGDTIYRFIPDSLVYSPKSGNRFVMQVDTTVDVDTVINRRGRIVKVDTSIVIGQRYLIENPDSKDKIGDIYQDALKNTASWE